MHWHGTKGWGVEMAEQFLISTGCVTRISSLGTHGPAADRSVVFKPIFRWGLAMSATPQAAGQHDRTPSRKTANICATATAGTVFFTVRLIATDGRWLAGAARFTEVCADLVAYRYH
jgi:hypothetical protein